MASMRTTSDVDFLSEELVWSWATPTDDDAAADKVSGMSTEDRLDSALPTSDDDREADDNRRPIDDDEVSDSPSVGQESPSHEDLGARNGRRAQPSDAPRGVASGGVIVETNRAPVLRKLDRKAILRFLEARERYARTFRDSRVPGQPRSLVSMVETTVLETICECELAVDVDDITEQELEIWLRHTLREDRSQDSQIEAKMKKLKMDLRIASPALRVMDLYLQFNQLIKDNGWKHIFEDADGKKMKIRFLVNAIEPKELKKMISNKLKLEPGFSKRPMAFMALLKEKTVNHEESRTIRATDDEKKPKKEGHKTAPHLSEAAGGEGLPTRQEAEEWSCRPL
jgi:hypothetical protein